LSFRRKDKQAAKGTVEEMVPFAKLWGETMEMGLLTREKPSRSTDIMLLLQAAKRCDIRLLLYRPADLRIDISRDRAVVYTHNRQRLAVRGLVNRLSCGEGEETEQACLLQGIPLMNTVRSVQWSRSKILASLAFCRAGIAQADKSWSSGAGKDVKSHGFPEPPCVYKPTCGSRGKNAVLLRDRRDVARFLGRKRRNREYYLEKYVENDGWDLRVVVIGGQVLGAIRKTAARGEWRTHVAYGGQAESFAVDGELEKLAVAAADCLGLSVAGIDIIQDKELGYLVLEANSVPGLLLFETTTGISMAEEVLRYFRERLL
jgi:RimK family alpha-L-glutamate ligase